MNTNMAEFKRFSKEFYVLVPLMKVASALKGLKLGHKKPVIDDRGSWRAWGLAPNNPKSLATFSQASAPSRVLQQWRGKASSVWQCLQTTKLSYS